MDSGRNSRQDIGRLGEDMACRFLEENGHTILERNFRSGHFEIDIISADCDGIHFVEVKTRKSGIQAPPQESVDSRKQRRMTKGALGYLRKMKRHADLECFFDIYAVTFENDIIRTEWIPHAFVPIYL